MVYEHRASTSVVARQRLDVAAVHRQAQERGRGPRIPQRGVQERVVARARCGRAGVLVAQDHEHGLRLDVGRHRPKLLRDEHILASVAPELGLHAHKPHLAHDREHADGGRRRYSRDAATALGERAQPPHQPAHPIAQRRDEERRPEQWHVQRTRWKVHVVLGNERRPGSEQQHDSEQQKLAACPHAARPTIRGLFSFRGCRCGRSSARDERDHARECGGDHDSEQERMLPRRAESLLNAPQHDVAPPGPDGCIHERPGKLVQRVVDGIQVANSVHRPALPGRRCPDKQGHIQGAREPGRDRGQDGSARTRSQARRPCASDPDDERHGRKTRRGWLVKTRGCEAQDRDGHQSAARPRGGGEQTRTKPTSQLERDQHQQRANRVAARAEPTNRLAQQGAGAEQQGRGHRGPSRRSTSPQPHQQPIQHHAHAGMYERKLQVPDPVVPPENRVHDPYMGQVERTPEVRPCLPGMARPVDALALDKSAGDPIVVGIFAGVAEVDERRAEPEEGQEDKEPRGGAACGGQGGRVFTSMPASGLSRATGRRQCGTQRYAGAARRSAEREGEWGTCHDSPRRVVSTYNRATWLS